MWRSLEGAVVDGKYRLKSLIGVDEKGAGFRAERLAAGARHPNLVECFGAGLWQLSDQPFFYLAMELAERQLSSLIQHWPLSARQAREVAQGVASALCCLHGRPAPVVHQGVRPSNVILVEGQWKLSDFDAAPDNARQPKLIRRVEPDYPLSARKARISGTVRLHIVVGEDGVVSDLRVVSGPSLLASATIRAVRQWLFQPMVANGQPTAFETDVDIRFPSP